MEYIVICTMIHNGELTIDAKSKEEAMELAQERLQNDLHSCNWRFGEATADYIQD